MKNLLKNINNKMRKWFLSLFFIILAFNVQSQSITIDDYNLDPGTDLIVSVNLDNMNNMGALTLFVGYDSLVMQFDTVININTQFSGLIFNDMQSLEQVGIAWSAVSSGVSVTSGVLCDIKFSYIGNSSDITFNNGCDIADFNADPIQVTYGQGSVSETFIAEITGLNLSYCTSESEFTLTGSPAGGQFKVNGLYSTTFNPLVLGAGNHTVQYEYTNAYGFGDIVSTSVDVYANPEISIQSTGVICYGQASGEATVNIISGQTPYSYNWSDGQSNQTAVSLLGGTYLVTVTDGNGCMDYDNVLIQASVETVYNLTVTHLSGVATNDGTIDLSIVSGSSPYIINWSNGETTEDLVNLPIGNYLLTITDNLGCIVEDSAEVKIMSSQEIIIPNQWSLLSFNVDLLVPNADSAFNQLEPNLILAKDENGAVYWVFFQINNIGDIEIGEAYQVKMEVQDTLNKPGYYIFPEQNPIELPTGWSLFGYTRTTPGLIVPILSQVVSNVLLVKNSDGNVYWPAFGMDFIVNLIPGQGYQIKMTATEQLIYPPN